MNFLIYWDGDLEREMLSDTMISKMKSASQIDYFFTAEGCASNNSTKAVPCMTADLFGDWREELIMRTSDNKKLRVWCMTYTTDVRLTTLMHDMQYRAQSCCQQSAYNQPPHVSYYLGSDAPLPERPKVIINGEAPAPPEPLKYEDGQYITNLTVGDTANAANWSVVTEPKQAGSTVFGDRAFKFTAMPEALKGAEWIQTACDSKKYAGEEAAFTAGADISAFVALDTRITDTLAWLGDWTKTADTFTDDGNPVVTYQLYKKDFAAGETVTLGALNQASCVNYAVAVTAQKAAPVIGDLNADGICDKADLIMMRDHLLTISALTPEQCAAADLNKDGKINAIDMTLLIQILLK
jgi:rhamnogalacturonan endolyase